MFLWRVVVEQLWFGRVNELSQGEVSRGTSDRVTDGQVTIWGLVTNWFRCYLDTIKPNKNKTHANG